MSLISIVYQPTILPLTLSQPYPNTNIHSFLFLLSTLHIISSLPGLNTEIQVVQYLNMATSTAALTPARVNSALMSSSSKTQRKANKVRQIVGLNSYGGLKAHNSVLSLGLPVTTEQCFANVVNSLMATSASGGKRRGGGGALSATCSKVDEIFQIAAIINGLTLIGVAVGFVLLRIEASVEESE